MEFWIGLRKRSSRKIYFQCRCVKSKVNKNWTSFSLQKLNHTDQIPVASSQLQAGKISCQILPMMYKMPSRKSIGKRSCELIAQAPNWSEFKRKSVWLSIPFLFCLTFTWRNMFEQNKRYWQYQQRKLYITRSYIFFSETSL